MREINKTNKRRKAGSYFLSEAELLDVLEDGYNVALKKAAIEAFEGRYETEELAAMVERQAILSQAIEHVRTATISSIPC